MDNARQSRELDRVILGMQFKSLMIKDEKACSIQPKNFTEIWED